MKLSRPQNSLNRWVGLFRNGCLRFNLSFKEEYARLHRFQDIQEARTQVIRYIDRNNHEPPDQSLDDQTPHQAFLNPKPAACITLSNNHR